MPQSENAKSRPSAILPEWRLARRLRDCYRVFSAELQNRLQKYDMRVSDWSHLRVISDEEGLTQVEISKRLGIEKASSTAVLDKLRKAGLISGKKRKDDLRMIGIHLTPQGRKMVQRLLPEVMSVITLATTSISNDEMANFIQTITKITKNIESAANGRQNNLELARQMAGLPRRTLVNNKTHPKAEAAVHQPRRHRQANQNRS